MTLTVEKDVMVAMRDGVELATDAWIPSVTPAPTLLVRLPYGKDLPQLLAYGLVPNVFALVEAGYAVVYQDCRGTFRSGGEFVPMLNEPADGEGAQCLQSQASYHRIVAVAGEAGHQVFILSGPGSREHVQQLVCVVAAWASRQNAGNLPEFQSRYRSLLRPPDEISQTRLAAHQLPSLLRHRRRSRSRHSTTADNRRVLAGI